MTSITQDNSRYLDSTDISRTTHTTDEDSQLMAEKSMHESSSGARCNGIMRVPITFLDKYNPKQFEILRMTELNSPLSTGEGKTDRPYINGKRMYARILIRRRREGE